MAAKLAFLFLLAFIAHGQSDPLPRNEDEIREYAEFLEKSVNGKPIPPATPELEYLQNEWERSGKFEGDIILTEDQREALVSDFIGDRNAIRDVNKLWPGGRVYYSISNDFDAKQKTIIRNAMDEIKSKTCIRFIERTNQKNYTIFTGKSDGCYSNVGYVGGAQNLNLAPNGCLYNGIVVHEILHTIGFQHMHSTYNRDEWIKVIWEKIIPKQRSNFNKFTRAQVTNLGQDYDYGSCMHYSLNSFSIDGSKTIIPRKNTHNVIIGQCTHLSPIDIRKINILYKCPRK